jgi:hypothetical protein
VLQPVLPKKKGPGAAPKSISPAEWLVRWARHYVTLAVQDAIAHFYQEGENAAGLSPNQFSFLWTNLMSEEGIPHE